MNFTTCVELICKWLIIPWSSYLSHAPLVSSSFISCSDDWESALLFNCGSNYIWPRNWTKTWNIISRRLRGQMPGSVPRGTYPSRRPDVPPFRPVGHRRRQRRSGASHPRPRCLGLDHGWEDGPSSRRLQGVSHLSPQVVHGRRRISAAGSQGKIQGGKVSAWLETSQFSTKLELSTSN